MGAGLLFVVAIIYFYVALEYVAIGRPGMAIAFTAYAVSNLGFVVDLLRR